VRGELISPEGWQFTPGAVRSIPLLQSQVKTYQRERRFVAQADWVSQRFESPPLLSAPAAPAARAETWPAVPPWRRRAG
jgi:hypothetical protein